MKQKKKDDLSFKTPILSTFCYSETRRIRIADILVDEDSDGDLFEMDDPRQCSTPRRIVSRWFSALKRGKATKRSEKRDKETEGPAGRCGKDSSSFNLGVACGLLYVIAAGKNEVNKMVELRTQMELILQNAKEELRSNNALLNSKPLESESNNEVNFTDFQQASSSAGSQFSLQSVAVGDECVAGMDQLEAELEAELERLQLHLDSQSSSSIAIASKSPQQQRIKGIGDIGGQVIEAYSSASTDYSEEMPSWGSGVAPLQLERKLHQVLEARQQERIKELEDALECAEHKLHDKEIEVSYSWWKDTVTTNCTEGEFP